MRTQLSTKELNTLEIEKLFSYPPSNERLFYRKIELLKYMATIADTDADWLEVLKYIEYDLGLLRKQDTIDTVLFDRCPLHLLVPTLNKIIDYSLTIIDSSGVTNETIRFFHLGLDGLIVCWRRTGKNREWKEGIDVYIRSVQAKCDQYGGAKPTSLWKKISRWRIEAN